MRPLQTESEWPAEVETLRRKAKRNQIRREWVAIVSLLGGLALPLVFKTGESLVFGLTTAGWGGLDLLMFALARRPVPENVEWLATSAFVSQAMNLLTSMVAVGFLFLSPEMVVRGCAAATLLQATFLSWTDAVFMRAVARVLNDRS